MTGVQTCALPIYAARSRRILEQFHIGDGGIVGSLFGDVGPLFTVFVLDLIDKY